MCGPTRVSGKSFVGTQSLLCSCRESMWSTGSRIWSVVALRVLLFWFKAVLCSCREVRSENRVVGGALFVDRPRKPAALSENAMRRMSAWTPAALAWSWGDKPAQKYATKLSFDAITTSTKKAKERTPTAAATAQAANETQTRPDLAAAVRPLSSASHRRVETNVNGNTAIHPGHPYRNRAEQKTSKDALRNIHRTQYSHQQLPFFSESGPRLLLLQSFGYGHAGSLNVHDHAILTSEGLSAVGYVRGASSRRTCTPPAALLRLEGGERS